MADIVDCVPNSHFFSNFLLVTGCYFCLDHQQLYASGQTGFLPILRRQIIIGLIMAIPSPSNLGRACGTILVNKTGGKNGCATFSKVFFDHVKGHLKGYPTFCHWTTE